MKKLTKFVAVAFLAALMLFAVGCKGLKPATVDGEKTVTVKIVNGENVQSFTVETNVLYFSDVFVLLVNEKKVNAKYSYSSYGMYVTEIDGAEMTQTQYWALYSDVEDELVSAITSTSDFDKPYEIDGKSYYSALVGASGMPCLDGQTYLWVLTDYAG